MTRIEKRLVVVYDVTGLSLEEMAGLEAEASVQAEASENHPSVRFVGSRITRDPIRVEAIDRDVVRTS